MLKPPEQPAKAPADDESALIVRSMTPEAELSVERSLRERAQRTAGLLWRLQSLTAAFTGAQTTDEIADAVVTTGLAAMDAGSGALALLNPDGETLTIIRATGYRTDVAANWKTFAVSDNLPLSEAVRTRELVLLESQQERNDRYPMLAAEETANNSFACVPLIVEQRVVGGLTYSFRDRRAFTDDERSFLLALGQLTAQALERARLYEAEHGARERAEVGAERLRFLARTSDLLASSLDYEKTLQSVARACVPKLADWCVVDLLEDDGVVKTLAVEHVDPEKVEWALRLRERFEDPVDGEGGVRRVIRSGEPELYEEVTDGSLVEGAQDEEHLAILRELGMTSVMIVPMRARDRVTGAITFVSTTESGRHYGPEDLNLAHEVAHRAAVAVENARLFRDVRAVEEDLRLQAALLRAQGEAMLDGFVVTDTEDRVLLYNKRVLELFDLTDDDLSTDYARAVRKKAARTIDPDAYMERRRQLTMDPNASGRDQIAFGDGREFERWTAPLIDETGELRGRGWYYRDITTERRAARQLEEGQRRAALLAEAGAALTSSTKYEVLLRRLANVMVEWFSDWCTIDLTNRDGSIQQLIIESRDTEHIADVERVDALRRYPSDPTASEGVRRVIETGQWEMRDEIRDDWLVREAHGREDYLALLRSLKLRSHLCVPLQVGARTLGALTFVTTGDGRVFGPADLALAQEIAFRAASAVDHARLFEEHRHISRTLQRSLLPPHLPEIPNIEVVARYHAAGEGYEVGGDFYDVFKTGREEWAVVLGDVCGKGADAAATTALARHTLRAAAVTTRKPHRILAMLNEAMLRAEQPFCTVAYARVQKVNSGARVTVTCGGHPLPFLIRAGGAVETFGRPGTLLGCFPEPALHEEVLELNAGDAIVLYTDGVTEARKGSNVMGEAGLRAALVHAAGGSAVEVADTIQNAALDFQDGDARDDIAIVVLKVRPKD
jgi:GAF domain-containing protein